MAMNNIAYIIYRRRLFVNKIKKSTNYMKKISLSSVYFINFFLCSNKPRVFSSFVTSLFSSVFFFFHSNGSRNQRQALLLHSFFNTLNKFILQHCNYFLKLVVFSLYIVYFLIRHDLGGIISFCFCRFCSRSLIIFISLI